MGVKMETYLGIVLVTNGTAQLYFLTPNIFLHKIPKFEVGKYIPWLSDHCILKTTILMNDIKTNKIDQVDELINAELGFIWDEEAKVRFSEGIKSDEVSEKVSKLENSANLTCGDIASELKEILLGTAKTCHLKNKKLNNVSVKLPPWFDKECITVKNKLKYIGKSHHPKPPI